MTIWWLNNIARANYEREELAKLAEQRDWLKNLSVTFGDGNLAVEFDIEHGAESYELVLTYPVVFPDAPPLVKTRGGKRISGHQYGASGELCLEFRPDNWRSDVTGAMMIESAYRLLSGENPQEGVTVTEIVDGHAVSVGQETRTTSRRFILSFQDFVALQGLQDNVLYNGVLGGSVLDETISARMMQIGEADVPLWVSESRFNDPTYKSDLFIVRNPASPLPVPPNTEDILACIADTVKSDIAKNNVEKCDDFYFLTLSEACNLYWVSLESEGPFVASYKTLTEPRQGRRLPVELELSDKKVAVVGCGSLGSKIAMHLARSGVGSLLLIDDDIFFEANLVRNELSVSDIGFHKARALRGRIRSVEPKLGVETRQIRLGGQESSETIVSAMKQLSECQLIVDATADAAAFNIISAVCKRQKIPVVWGSVFAGGIGGIVGRALPDLDPEPNDARQQVRRWCESQDVEAPKTSNDNAAYEAQGDDGAPEIASDADVSVIASYVARFALDALSQTDRSDFPYSAYVIGLAPKWIFSAPFDTRPIEYTGQTVWSSEETKTTPEELAEFLKLLVPLEADSGT